MSNPQKKTALQNNAKPTDENFEQKCLEFHNTYRAQHGCPPLKLNAKLNSYAKQWAMNLSNSNKMEHRNQSTYGENIYFAEGMQITAENPVKAWYNEISQYDFAASKFSPETGHFTQLIWKDTKEVGIGIARKGKKVWVVANYTPPGNVMGLFKNNVPPKQRE